MLDQKKCASHLVNPVTSLDPILPTTMDQMFMSPQNAYVEILTPIVMAGSSYPVCIYISFMLLNDYYGLLKSENSFRFFNLGKLSIRSFSNLILCS